MSLALPEDVALALDAAGVRTLFETMSASHRREWLRAIDDAKTSGTRTKRITDCVTAMRARLESRT